ncbi:hypothetical protein [Actinosynnema sp. NPDC020468]|uniref:hypothetical protein n=1 Tax=Actinosynnema sp. NPDC020468 TaxID=3154488 RepID=UPI0033F70E9D
MEHTHGGLDAVAQVSPWALGLRLVLLLATALVAGVGVARPLLTTPPRRVVLGTALLAAVSAVLAVVSAAALGANPVGAAAHVALVVAVPALLGRPAAARWVAAALALLVVLETVAGGSGVLFVVDTVHVAAVVTWFGAAVLVRAEPTASRRFGPVAVALGAGLAVAGAVRLVASGLAVDRRLHESALGLVLLAAVVLPSAVTVLAVLRSERVYRFGTAGVALSFVAWSALAALPQPPVLPTPGVPVLVDTALAGRSAPVLVSPHRPGRNLVHLPASAGADVRVEVGGVVTPAVPRAGADGTWAEVDLPAGRGEITLRAAGDDTTVEVDTGAGTGPVVDADAPECASAALGGLIAGRRDVLTTCPADTLSTEDEAALRKLVSFLASRGTPGVTLAADGSARGKRAADVVAEAAGAANLRLDPGERPDNALIAVSGWAKAADVLHTAAARQAEAPVYGHGVFLAPWLLTTPLATSVTTVSVPLAFDPREQLPIGYAVAVGNAFGGENPTPAGFRGWLGGQSAGDRVQVYAVAQVTAMPMGPNEVHAPGMPMTEELPGQWIPKTTVVPVSAPLL